MINEQSFNILEVTEQKIWNLGAVKNYLRISSDFDDELLSHLLETSVKAAENFIGINLTYKKISMKNTNKYCLEFFLKHRPILEVQKVSIKNNNTETDLNTDQYLIDLENAKLHLPRIIKRDELKIIFAVGIDEKKLFPDIKQGILIHTYQMFERQDSSISNEIKNLYAPYRNIKI